MPQTINLNVPPYNDDFDTSKGYYKVLFRPGFSIQTRELTNLQSILQNQIESLGRSKFKQGQQVIPGEVAFNNQLDYVKLSSVSEVAVNTNGNVVFQKYDIAKLLNSTLNGLSSGVTARVISYSYGSDTESDILFVQYTNSGNSGNEKTFRQGETLEALDIVDSPTLVVGTDGSVLPTTIDVQDYDTKEIKTIDSPAMGFASAVKVESGVYFINGYFVNNPEQIIVVDKYYNKPSAKVGFTIKETIVKPEDDKTLYDNARGFSNFSAPGAHRLKIDLSLKAYEYDTQTGTDYVQLVILKNGEIQQLIRQNDYDLIEETLARRTYDESGDYVVDNFSLDLRDYYQKDNNKGLYPLNQETNLVNGKTKEEAEELMVANIGSGKAYIKGYEIINKNPKYITVNKARETLDKNDNRIKLNSLSYFNVTNVHNSVALNTVGSDLNGYSTVFLSSTFTDGAIGYNNSESSSDDRQTLVRRGVGFKLDSKQTNTGEEDFFGLSSGIVTLYLANPGNYGTRSFPTSSSFGSSLTSLWYVSSLGPSAASTVSRKLTLLSYSRVKRPDIIQFLPGSILTLTSSGTGSTGPSVTYTNVSPTSTSGSGTGALFTVVKTSGVYTVYVAYGGTGYAVGDTITIEGSVLGGSGTNNLNITVTGLVPSDDILELTVLGNKLDIQNLLKEYDEIDPSKRKKLFASESDANNYYFQTSTTIGAITPYSEIFDYNEVITPIIGVCKPKDFSLLELGSGFDANNDKILSRGRLPDGREAYNSIFRLSYFNPNFFTKITLDSPIQSGTFLTGKYVTGATSGAYGIIEGSSDSRYTSVTQLFVKTLSGTFISGETITDELGNSLRIAREGTISHFVVLRRGVGYPQSTTKIKINGVEYTNSAIELNFLAGQIYKVLVKDKNLVSTVYSNPPAISFDTGGVTVTQEATVLPVLYRKTVVEYGPQNVKSMYGALNSSKDVFSADVESFSSNYITTANITDFTFSGSEGSKFLECTSFSGDAYSDLIQGDIVQFTDSGNKIVRAIVQKAEKPNGLVKSKIYLDTVLKRNVTNASIIRVRPVVQNSSKSSLLVPVGSNYIKSVVSSEEDSKIKYYFRRDFVSNASVSGGNITFAAQLPFGTQRFASYSKENFIVTVINNGGATNINVGDIIYLRSSDVDVQNSTDSTSNLSSGSVIITLPSSFFVGVTDYTNLKLKLTATIEVSKSRPKLKTLYTNKRILIISPGDKIIPLRGTDFDTNSTDVLSYSDVIRIKYVYEGTAQTPPVVSSSGELVSGTDITERFTFDDGQRDTMYDVSRLILKPGYNAPTGQVIVAFDYFDHSQGDFCTVDSYLHEAGVSVDEIPSFNSPSLGKVSLRDVFDFRPKVDYTTVISGYQDTSILSVAKNITPGLTNYDSFTGSGGAVSNTPATEPILEYTISFNSKQYLDRIDGIYVDKKGQFFVSEGNSSLNPTKPTDIVDSLPLYYLYVPAYTVSPNDVKIIPVDNKRYTMRDIGKIEQRVTRLEKYTMLSILEQQAMNTQIKDDIGVDRFRSGFVVDGFENHGIGQLTSLDYKCAIDTQQSVLRPRSIETSLKLVEVNTRKEQRDLDGYARSQDVITLPYTNTRLLGNDSATKTLNINPFVVVQFVGDLSLSPNVDQWYNDREKPLILDNDSQVFSAIIAKEDAREGYSSLHNNFSINWVGTNSVFSNTTPLNTSIISSSSSSTASAKSGSSSNISPQNNQLSQGVPSVTIGSDQVNISLQQFCRSIPVYFVLTRLKPRTRFYAFIDGINVDRWTIQDLKFTGVGGNSLGTFNSTITTDANGNASGMILIPSGFAPSAGTGWTGDKNTIQYDESSNKVFLTVGNKTVRFTTSAVGDIDSSVDSFAEIKYYATGRLPEQPSSIVSTNPAILKATEGVQYANPTTSGTTGALIKPNPLSQTFKIEGYPGGVFVSGMDLYFKKKSATIPAKVSLVNIENKKPGRYIVPGGECVLSPDTYLKIYTNGTLTFDQNENATGGSSGASGPVKEVYDRNNNIVAPSVTGVYTLSNSQVYTLVLSNHNGRSFIQGENLTFPSLTAYNAAQATNLRVTIARDSGRVVGLKINSTGTGYETASLTIESPQLVGGVRATATCLVSSGNIFDVTLGVNGSGYTDAPAVIINGTGASYSGASIEAIIEIDTPAVRMGIATDPGTPGILDSTTPTTFVFQHPVYLQNNTEYAFYIESDSIDYEIWASRLNETEVVTGSTVTTQPLLGSVFKSQNVDSWTEDIFEDIKFNLYRCRFDTSKNATLLLQNEQLGYELLNANPLETDSLSGTDATSKLFRNNNRIIKVSHLHNGFEDSGKSWVNFKRLPDVAGIDSTTLVETLFNVSNCGSEFYNIDAGIRAGSNVIGGGTEVLATYNRKYEKLFAQVGYLTFNETKISSKVKTTNIVPVDSGFVNYSSYSQSPVEDGFENTFLNEQHYFTNQKVVCSRVNELKNSLQNSLVYKINFSSSVDYLSPVIDLRASSVKLVNNHIEKASGLENRFGRRNQVIKFYPVYKFGINGSALASIDAGNPSTPKIITGNTSNAKAIIARFDTTSNELYVRLLSDNLFIPSEVITFQSQPSLVNIRVNDTGLTDVTFNFVVGSTVTAIDKTNTTLDYTNKISGKVVFWDNQSKELFIANNKEPINGNYTAASTPSSDYSRRPITVGSSIVQPSDIFRVNDFLTYENQPSTDKSFLEIKEVKQSSGILFVGDNRLNSSSLAKYVTKEISLENPANSLDVRLTANIFEEDDIRLLYKVKTETTQVNFEDIGWEYFNTSGESDIRIIPSSDNTIVSYNENQSSYKEYKYSISNLNEFTSFAIKIVMRSSNPVFVPKIQDIRIIATF